MQLLQSVILFHNFQLVWLVRCLTEPDVGYVSSLLGRPRDGITPPYCVGAYLNVRTSPYIGPRCCRARKMKPLSPSHGLSAACWQTPVEFPVLRGLQPLVVHLEVARPTQPLYLRGLSMMDNEPLVGVSNPMTSL